MLLLIHWPVTASFRLWLVVSSLAAHTFLPLAAVELHFPDGHQFACILFQIVGIGSLAQVKLFCLYVAGICLIKQLEVLLPGWSVHLSHRCGSFLQVGVDAAYLCLLAVAADVEAVEVDENLLTHWQIAVESAAVDIYEDSTCGILQCHLLIEVAADVIARDVTLDHHRLVDELVSATGDGGLVVALGVQW